MHGIYTMRNLATGELAFTTCGRVLIFMPPPNVVWPEAYCSCPVRLCVRASVCAYIVDMISCRVFDTFLLTGRLLRWRWNQGSPCNHHTCSVPGLPWKQCGSMLSLVRNGHPSVLWCCWLVAGRHPACKISATSITKNFLLRTGLTLENSSSQRKTECVVGMYFVKAKKVKEKVKNVDLYSAYHVLHTSNALSSLNWAARPVSHSPQPAHTGWAQWPDHRPRQPAAVRSPPSVTHKAEWDLLLFHWVANV